MDNRIQYYAVALKAILKRSDGKVLVLKIPDGFKLEGFYDFPGGRIEQSEFDINLMDILSREIYEELGNIQFKVQSSPVGSGRTYCGPNKKFDYEEYIFCNFYECEYISGDIVLSEEHSEYMWVDLETLDLEKYFSQAILEGIQHYLQK